MPDVEHSREHGVVLSDLVPIAVVVTAGCEPCAEKMVARALQRGSTRAQVERTLRIVAGLRGEACFAAAVGAQAVERMERPLAAALRTLRATAP